MTQKTKNSNVEEKIIEVPLRGIYLPNALVKLGEFSCNAEARKHIRNSGILVDGNLIKDIDYPLKSENLIEINGTKYNVRVL